VSGRPSPQPALRPDQPAPRLFHILQPLPRGVHDAQDSTPVVAAVFVQAAAHQAQRLDKVDGLGERRFHLPDKLMQLRAPALTRRTACARHGIAP